MIIQASVVLKTVIDSDCRCDNMCLIVIFRVKVNCNLSIGLHRQGHDGLTDRRPTNIATLVDQSNRNDLNTIN